MGLSIVKDTNQYYGKYFENAICSVINNENFINNTNYNNFTEEDLELMQKDAKYFVSNNFPSANKAKWVGNNTETENCDIIIDNKHIEIKYVSSGNGTY